MPPIDLILLHAPHVYDFRKIPQLHGPVSDLVPSSFTSEMYPVGFASISEYLEKAGFRVRIVNLAYHMLRSGKFDVEAFIKKLEAPVFGIDLHWMMHAHGSVEVAKLVKKYHPKSKVMFGGYMSSYYYKDLLKYPEIDLVMRGDTTEEPLRQMMQAIKDGSTLEKVPNLVWKDEAGKIHENAFSHVPTGISDVMVNQYSGMVRSVLRYRDMLSIIPYRNWLKRPVTAVYTCRGCTYDCLLCGASRTAIKGFLNRAKPAFRTAEDIYKDIKNSSRVSRAPIFITHDIRLAGPERADRLLELLEKGPVKNNLMFELFRPATPEFLERLAKVAPGFTLDISPQTHDERLRKLQGNNYDNASLETMFDAALKLGTTRLDTFFIIGLPEQTHQSVMETIDYCEYLLERYKGDKRLFLFIAAQSPFMAPGSIAFENAEKYGYKILYKTFEEYRQALTMPCWKYTLNYETKWLNRQQIADTAYEAIARLTRAKARYGQIPQQLADAQLKRIEQAQELEKKLDIIIGNGNKPEELAAIAPEIEAVNSFRAIQHRQLDVPAGLLSLRIPNAIWNVLFKRK